LTPHFLRKEGHVRSYDGDSDSLWRVVLHTLVLLLKLVINKGILCCIYLKIELEITERKKS
jgi:hypothetical protein